MGKLRVLLVEDEAIAARAAAVMLERAGCEVTEIVDTGEGAVEAATSQNPDLILMDIRLKGSMDGIEAATLIRASHSVRIVFVSAYLEEELEERGAALEGFAYLAKPIDYAALSAVVRDAAGGFAGADPR